jgi:fructose-specific phosphotransferase system IIA component
MGRDMTGEEFLALFEEDLCLFDLQARDKKEVLREITRQLRQAGKISDEEIVLDMLMRRESLGSTALGDGVAVPHGRTLMVRNLVVAFGRCREGLDFDSPDGKPVHLFFLLIAPYRERNNRYLPALGKIAEFFRHKELREKVLNTATFEEFLDVLSAESRSS